MQNVYDPRLADEVQIGRFPGNVKQHYTWAPVVDEDGPDRVAAILFQPTPQEAIELLQGGTIQVRVAGVKTPPRITVATCELGRIQNEPDMVAARVLYDAAGGHPLPWEDASDAVRGLYRERAAALWRVFLAQQEREGA